MTKKTESVCPKRPLGGGGKEGKGPNREGRRGSNRSIKRNTEELRTKKTGNQMEKRDSEKKQKITELEGRSGPFWGRGGLGNWV